MWTINTNNQTEVAAKQGRSAVSGTTRVLLALCLARLLLNGSKLASDLLTAISTGLLTQLLTQLLTELLTELL